MDISLEMSKNWFEFSLGLKRVLRDIDYSKLKKSFEFLVQRFMPQELFTPWADPIRALKRNEKRSATMARRGLYAAIGDLVEATQDFSPEQVRDADAKLESRGAYTLSFLRSRFSRRKQKT
jgi:hypothetical protein